MSLPRANDKPLFTPGPLTTSRTVKTAMLRDLGSRDTEFIDLVRDVRRRLLDIAGVSQEKGYEAVPMQGSGTFSLEAVVSSCIQPGKKLLVIINGAYGERLAKMAQIHGIDTVVLRYKECDLPDLSEVRSTLEADPGIAMVSVCHCETTSGIMNPIHEIGQIVAELGRQYFVDSMSAFGAAPFDFEGAHIDYLVSSSNKCIEGVPGFAFVICKRESLAATEGWSRTMSLDVHAQWKGLESNGQFRFTPPTHAFLAFHQALVELELEGGAEERGSRYRANYECLIEGMGKLGFEEYVARELQGYIITSFRYPAHDWFDFDRFYDALNDRGFVIYPGKVSDADCFRIGNIGRLFTSDVASLLGAIRDVLSSMNPDREEHISTSVTR
ncbi:MAG: 2-aminoethylphosphonate--pyruvate transaminase [Planctomycetales bacterium]|nr:2-aminoethylphosphonate--pyruvate transaminase [Planctomycetales bacterium]